MAFYTGPSHEQGEVTIGSPDRNVLPSLAATSDVRNSVEHWFTEAQKQEDILYFSIFLGKKLIGQILLHNMNASTGESLIAYHIFHPQARGQGFGTQALRILQSYVLRQTKLTKLVIITSRDNMASQRVAQNCGFQYAGTSREDPVNEVVFEWHVPRGSD